MRKYLNGRLVVLFGVVRSRNGRAPNISLIRISNKHLYITLGEIISSFSGVVFSPWCLDGVVWARLILKSRVPIWFGYIYTKSRFSMIKGFAACVHSC